ncbi:hypothetical protein BK146_24610 [Paenibacillus sp. FSL R7-0333]|nr:hypothetical protein BK146_24610 [Paenibacillus sp. FSL R7-0333]
MVVILMGGFNLNGFKPYIAIDKSVYFTDGVEEVNICTFEGNGLAQKVSSLLNNAYHAAYQDGLNAALSEQHKELLDKILALTIENDRNKKMMDLKGGDR